MHRKSLVIPLLLLASAAAARTAGGDGPAPDTETADTVIVVDKVQVTAIKQGLVLRSQPVAASIVGGRAIERGRIGAVKNLSQTVPNFHAPDYGSRMTSSIYVRGLGARIDQPVIGLNIDNVPVLNKDNFDTELADAERIEVLRGPQSTLYGRNTMGGVVNVYTLSPLTYEGVRLTAEYGSGDSYRFRASSYYKLSPDLGMAVTGYFTHTGGFFDNDCTGEKCDWERLGGGRWKTQWRNNRGVRIDNTFSFSALDQGGYPYAYAGEDIVRDGKTVIRNGQISYNDPSSYRRTTVSDGLTVRYDAAKYSVSSITSYQYSDDEMTLDQDFTPESWFTLRQARREHALTEDIVFRSHDGRRYGWLLGAFGFYRHGVMEAPVHFKRTGIEELIVKNANEHLGAIWNEEYSISADELPLYSDFRMPVYGGAVYHESNLRLGRWRLTAGIRFDVEHTSLAYHSRTDMDYFVSKEGGAPAPKRISIDEGNRIAHTYCEVLPKVSLLYAFDEVRNLYMFGSQGLQGRGIQHADVLRHLERKAQMADGRFAVRRSGPDVLRAGIQLELRDWAGTSRAWRAPCGAISHCSTSTVRDQQLTDLPGGTDHRPHDDQRRAHAQSSEPKRPFRFRRGARFDINLGVRIHRRPVCPVRNDRKERRRRSRAHQLQGQPHPLRPAAHPFGRSRHGPSRPA